MQNIINNIKTYIQTRSTDYALLIKGLWGSGKTYFVKKTLFPEIEKEKFKPLYISLNGISEITQLEQTILLEYLKIPGDKKKIRGLFNVIGTGIDKLSSFLSKGYFSLDITKLNLVSLLPLDRVILFFDDLERINSAIDIDEILGYINNNFVEHRNVKVIIVGDITKIANTKKFENIKEKLIGREFNFFYNTEDIWKLILIKYTSQNEFLEFLNRNKDNITILLESFKEFNLRTVFFFIDILNKVSPYMTFNRKNLSEQVILFSFLITLEFKKGSFHIDEYEKRKALKEMQNNLIVYDLLGDNSNSKENIPRSYAEIFYSNYLKELRHLYRFFDSVYFLIVFGAFNEELLKNEFSPSPKDEYIEALHKLNDLFVLSEDEINACFNKIMDGLHKGIYNVYTHLYVFNTLYPLASQYIINISISDLKQKIYNSLDIAKQRNEFDKHSFDAGDIYTLPNQDSQEVFKKIKTMHDSFFKNQIEVKVKNILEELGKEKADYTKVIHSFLQVKFSDYFTSDEIIKKLRDASTYSIIKFGRFLVEKYRYDGYSIVDDKTLIEELISAINNGINNDENSAFQKMILQDFNRMLNNIITEFNKHIPPTNTNN